MIRVADASRDSVLALRRVERQQWLIERLYAARGRRAQLADLARGLGVSTRTVARDVERLRDGGLPLDVRRGRTGGVALAVTAAPVRVELDLPEAAALISSLAVLGPTVTPSASSAMRKLVAGLISVGSPG